MDVSVARMTAPPPPPSQLNDAQQRGKDLLKKGIIAYYVLAIFPIASALTGSFSWAWAIALCMCILLVPTMTMRGSVGWKHFGGLVGLFTLMTTLPGACALADSETRGLGILSLAVFALSVFIVRVFLMNMDVATYMTVLQKERTSKQKN